MKKKAFRGSFPGFALTALTLALAASCSPSGGGSGSSEIPGAGQVDLLVSSGSMPELLAFEATLADLRLVDAQGAMSENLLSGPTALELLDLADTAG